MMRIDIWYATGLQLRVRNRNLIFLFLNQNICCGYSKEPSQWEGSLEHPKHKLKLLGKKIFTILLWNPCSSKPMCEHTSCSYSVQPSLWDFPLGRKANVSQYRYDGQHNIHSHAYDAIYNLVGSNGYIASNNSEKTVSGRYTCDTKKKKKHENITYISVVPIDHI